jgi:tetratricopeptide (TPR) repeat protein
MTGHVVGGVLMSDYFDLGGYERRVTTSSAEAQVWFTRGLVWAYGFNHEEAAACFERAIEADPDCALAHWGLAYALGPNYNKPWEAFDPATCHPPWPERSPRPGRPLGSPRRHRPSGRSRRR